MFMENEIKKIRIDLGWTQKEMGNFLGLDASTISRIETGKQSCSRAVKKLLHFLHKKMEQEASE